MDLNSVTRYLTTFSELVEASRTSFKRYFWIGTALWGVLILSLGLSFAIETIIGAVVISLAALAPWYLWVRGTAKGLPIWPMFALTALWAYALPLVTEHPVVVQFPPYYHLVGSLTVAAFLVVGTLAWLPFVRKQAQPPRSVRVLPMRRGRVLFFCFLAFGLFVTFVTNTATLDLTGQYYSIIRAFSLGLSNLAIFYFGYQMGARQLRMTERILFIALLIVSVVVSFTTMLLINAMSMLLLSFISYFLGRGRIPWTSVLLTAILFYFLHAGKTDQREQYWGEIMWRPVTVIEYPKFFGDWIGHSSRAIGEQFDQTRDRRDPAQPQSRIWERSSLMHLFLFIQYSTPDYVPFLNGQSYVVIPELLIPRLLTPGKVTSHFGNQLLALHYGISDSEEDVVTSVGFGLMCEAFANFGYVGCLLVPVVLGALSGWITNWSMSVPIMSFRFLFGVLCLSAAFQVEYTAGVLTSSLFQSSAALAIVAIVFMQNLPLQRARQLVPLAREEIEAREAAQRAVLTPTAAAH
jgi:hypothetical protein